MSEGPSERTDPNGSADDYDGLSEDSTRILEKSKYLLGITQTRIDNLKQELESRRVHKVAGEDVTPPEETERELQEARLRLRQLQERLRKSKKSDASSGVDSESRQL